jgi:hypothetical protein
MELLSKEYGWTPNEIREQSYHDISSYLKIINIKRKIEELETKKLKTRK